MRLNCMTTSCPALHRRRGSVASRFWARDLLGCVVPRRRPCGVATKTLVDLIKLAGESPSLFEKGAQAVLLLLF